MLLNAMRQSATSIFAKILFSLLLFSAVIGLALVGGTGSFTGGFHRDDVATVAGQSVAAAQFDGEVRNILSRNQINPATAYKTGAIDQILQSEINSRLLRRAEFDLGLQVGDASVVKEVNDQLTPEVTHGLPRKEALQRLLQAQGLSEAAFAADMRDDMASSILKTAIQAGGAVVPDAEAADIWRFAHEERTITFATLPDSAITDYKQPTDAILLPFYQAGKERYAIPEARSFSMLLLTPQTAKADTAISDTDLQKAYQDNIANFSSPERRQMDQAVFQTQAEAQAAADKVKAGSALKSFGKAYLGQQDFEKNGLDPAIATPAFTAKTGDVIGPVQTALGWHVLKIVSVLPPATKPFDTVREQVKTDLLKNRASDALYAESGKIDDAINGGATLEEAAKENNLQIVKASPAHGDGNDTDGKPALSDYPQDRAAILKTVFQTEEGETAPAQELKSGGYAIIRTDHITAKSWKPFADVKPDLAKLWIADQQDVLNGDKAHAALNALDAKTTSLEKIAANNHGRVQTVTFTRLDTPPAPFTPTAAQKFFEVGDGKNAGASMKDGYIVGTVTAVKLPLAPADVKDIKDKEMQSLPDEYMNAYLDSLRDKYGVKVNEEQLAKMYGGTPAPADQ